VSGWTLPISAAAFWSGILLSGTMPAPRAPVALGMLLAGVGGLAASAVKRAWESTGARGALVRIAVAAAAFALLGGGWGTLRAALLASSPLVRLAGRSVEAVGAIGTDPQPGALGWTASLQIARVAPGLPGWATAIAVQDAVWAEGRGPPPRLAVGDRVAVEGTLRSPTGSFGEYLRHRGYAAELSVSTLRVVGPPSSPLVRAADGLRAALTRSFARVFPPREAGLLMGLSLGDVSHLDPAVAERFRATGLTHLLAVSGENVAMFLAPILGLAALLRLGRIATFGLGLFAVAFFVVLTRAEPSVLRAAAMTSIVMIGSFAGRPRSAPAVIGAAILLLLAVNPTLVYAIGFQLSVAAKIGIAALTGPLSARLRFLPRGLAMAAGTTVGAQAGVTPLLLHYFGAVPTVTIIANLLAAPAVGPGMVLGLVAAALGVVWRTGARAVAMAASVPIGYLEAVAAHLARWPLPSLTSTGGPLALAVGTAAVGVVAVWLRSGPRLSRRGLFALGVVLALVVGSSALGAGRPRALAVTFFDVGEGDAALVRSPGGATMLIDGGPDPEQVAVKLASLGVRRLDVVVATHPHQDHYDGLAAVLARFPAGLVLDTGCRPPEVSSPSYLAFLAAVRASGVPQQHPVAGDTYTVGDLRVDVLSPDRCWQGTNSDANNDSLVLMVSWGPDKVLFANEPEAAAQQELLDKHAPIVAPVLNVPHHGSATSIAPFLRAVHEAVAVVSVGSNTYGHPAPSTMATLRASGARVYRTDRSGDVTVSFEPDGAVSVESTRDG
jgi:competence protein ComEC